MSESITLSLNGRWKSRDFAPGQGLEAGAHPTGHDDTNWHMVPVPGDVHTALVEIGRLAPLFYNMNLETCQRVECQERVIRGWNETGWLLKDNDITESCL